VQLVTSVFSASLSSSYASPSDLVSRTAINLRFVLQFTLSVVASTLIFKIFGTLEEHNGESVEIYDTFRYAKRNLLSANITFHNFCSICSNQNISLYSIIIQNSSLDR
jgi:hypothetical protein